jgi:YHS domain-containing protein
MVASRGVQAGQELPDNGSLVETACRWQVRYSAELPSLRVEGKRIYFCLPACIDAYHKNPHCSCLNTTVDCDGS